MQIPILNGITTDSAPDLRTSYPRNLVPVPKDQSISKGYLRPADGIVQSGTGPGATRGSFAWHGEEYRVLGTKLCRVAADGTVTVLGDVGSGGAVSMDAGFDRLAVASGGRLYYWDKSTLTQVTDPDLGLVLDVCWLAGYFMTTDGVNLVVTDLADPLSVNPLAYGSSEADPDPVMAIDELRGESYAFNRYTIEVFQNVGGTGFPFAPIDGAQVTRGIVGTHAYCKVGDTFAFVGSGVNESPSVYLMTPGNSAPISTREIDTLLQGYTDAELSEIVMECKADKQHRQIQIHLPDRCLVYDLAASMAVNEPVWFTLDSSLSETPSTYRARGLVWCYGRWNVGDPTGTALGYLTSDISSHYGQPVAWEFGTGITYNNGSGGIVHELELVALSGRVAAGTDPVIWTSYSLDGQTWSQERTAYAGKQGQRTKRIAWRTLGTIGHWRVQRFRGTSDAHIAFVRLEAQIEGLFTKAAGYG